MWLAVGLVAPHSGLGLICLSSFSAAGECFSYSPFFGPPVGADRRLLQAAAAAASRAAAPLEDMDVDDSSDAWPAAKKTYRDTCRQRDDGLACITTSGRQLYLRMTVSMMVLGGKAYIELPISDMAPLTDKYG
ncbi:hypothetical protein J3F84DRAFT_284435 [Trichoderma pleuroticola]